VTQADLTSAATQILAAVPFAAIVGVSVVEVSTEDGVRAVLELPDNPALHNHVAGPHAGAQFTLGESASGAVVFAAFGEYLDRAVPLTVRADITYRKFATGSLRATATLDRPVADVAAELAAGQRPEFAVLVEISRADGTLCAEMTVVWTLRPNR
jgi:acyl-coenzyme A thioesterase PaaI-like protein